MNAAVHLVEGYDYYLSTSRTCSEEGFEELALGTGPDDLVLAYRSVCRPVVLLGAEESLKEVLELAGYQRVFAGDDRIVYLAHSPKGDSCAKEVALEQVRRPPDPQRPARLSNEDPGRVTRGQ